MNSNTDLDRAGRVQELVGHALSIPEEARPAWLDSACGAESSLRAEVDEILALESEMGTEFLKRDALQLDRGRLDPEDSDLVGTDVGPFKIIGRLGAGGMGEVYEGLHTKLDRRVAVKVIRREGRFSASHRQRFLDEARLLSSLQHPNLCQVHDFFRQGELDVLVMELLDGETANHAVTSPLSKARILDIAIDVARALGASHARGIVHRDLKPENVMVTASGTAKVLDFGIAKLERGPETQNLPSTFERASTQSVERLGVDSEARLTRAAAASRFAGTPGYLSPEQARGERLTTASDMFSFGRLLCGLLVGGSRSVSARSACTDESVPKSLSRAERKLVAALLAPEPEKRPTANQALDSLQHIRGRRRRFVLRTAVAALVLLVAGASLKYTLDLRTEREHAEAARAESEAVAEFLSNLFLQTTPERGGGVARTDVELLDYGVARLHQELKDQPILRARLLHTLGDVFQKRGEIARAEALLRQALRLRETHLESGHAETAMTLHRLSVVAWDASKLDESVALARRSLAMLSVSVGPDHIRLVHPLNMLGITLGELGDLDEAEAVLRRALAIFEQHQAAGTLPASERPINTLHNLAFVLYDQGRYEEAATYSGRMMKVAEESARPDLGAIGDALALSGLIRLAQGRPEEALRYSQRAVAITTKVYGSSHYATGSALLHLAEVYVALDDPASAADVLQQGIGALEHLGRTPEDAQIREALMNLGNVHFALGDASRTQSLMTRILSYTGASLESARALLLRGKALARQDRQTEARADWHRAQDILATIENPPRDLKDELETVLGRRSAPERNP